MDNSDKEFWQNAEYRDEFFDPLCVSIESEPNYQIDPRELPAILWLAGKIKINPKNFISILQRLRSKGFIYKNIFIPKKNGGKRQCYEPDKPLKKIQDRINKYVFKSFKPRANVFGFSGGNIDDAIRPHLKSKSMLRVDCKDAFPTVTFNCIFDYFTAGKVVCSSFYGPDKVINYGLLSWYSAMIITELVIYKGRLPQGAPTSPRLFDLVCAKMDKHLNKLAKNVQGNYTRYADNIFFSISKEKFPHTLRQVILKMIEGRRWRPKFKWHKLSTKKIIGTPQRILGLNIINGEIHNTRVYKRRLRKAIHHVNWILDHNMDYEKAWQKLRGLLSFAKFNTMPKRLMEDYEMLEKRIFSLRISMTN